MKSALNRLCGSGKAAGGWTMVEYCLALGAVVAILMAMSGNYRSRGQQYGDEILNQLDPTSTDSVDRWLSF